MLEHGLAVQAALHLCRGEQQVRPLAASSLTPVVSSALVLSLVQVFRQQVDSESMFAWLPCLAYVLVRADSCI